MKAFLAFLLFALVSLSPQAAAVAEERSDVQKAKAHFEHGERLYRVSRYREALEQFKEGFVAKADPVFLFNIAQCHRLLGDRDEAITFYRRYVRADPRSSLVPEVEKRIRDLEAQKAAQPTHRAPPAAAVTTAPAPALPPAPVSPPVPASPPPVAGPAVPTLAPSGPSEQPAPAMVLTARNEEPAPESRPLYRQWWLWTGVGIGVVAIAVTAALLLGGSSESGCGGGVTYCGKL